MIEAILTFLIRILELWRNRESLKTFGAKRDSRWRLVRAEHLRKNPTCALCGGTEVLEVHHIKMFSTNPELELEPSNLITLCESNKKGVVCHRFFGHYGNYRRINPSVNEDVKIWNAKIK